MKIAAYQFGVTSDIDYNFGIIKKAVRQAAEKDVKLLIFPECALTGYPPRDINSSANVNFHKLDIVYKKLQDLVDENEMYIICGTIVQEGEN